MKIVHVSDIHINPTPILGHDPVDNFRKCLAHIEEFQSDPDRIVITGDLTHHGRQESYRLLKSILDASSLQGDRRPRLLIGNHDDRSVLSRELAPVQRDEHGYLQWTEETDAGLFVYLDTAEHGTHAGHYCPDRQDWLKAVLEDAEAYGKPVWLFMHHNPIAVEVANADEIGIVQEAEFQAILKRYRDTIRHIFFGHCHFTLSGHVCGIPFSAPRSTNHACWPDFSGIAERMGYGALTPNYNVCFLGRAGTIVHSIDFLDEGKVMWVA